MLSGVNLHLEQLSKLPSKTFHNLASAPEGAVLAPSFITASHQQFLWCSIVERLEQLVLSVYCFPSYCLLTPLMSPKDIKCKLIDWLIGTTPYLWSLSCEAKDPGG